MSNESRRELLFVVRVTVEDGNEFKIEFQIFQLKIYKLFGEEKLPVSDFSKLKVPMFFLVHKILSASAPENFKRSYQVQQFPRLDEVLLYENWDLSSQLKLLTFVSYKNII